MALVGESWWVFFQRGLCLFSVYLQGLFEIVSDNMTAKSFTVKASFAVATVITSRMNDDHKVIWFLSQAFYWHWITHSSTFP